jgi:hypothetical protein
MKNFYIISILTLAIVTIAGAASMAALPKPNWKDRYQSTTAPTPTPKSETPTNTNPIITPLDMNASSDENCIQATTIIKGTKYCSDTNNIYGIFTDQIVAKCKSLGGGNACNTKLTFVTKNGTKVLSYRYSKNLYNSTIK